MVGYIFIDELTCSNSNYNSYLIDDSTGTIGKCHSNCDSCSQGPIGDIHNCNTCKEGFFLIDNNCEDRCPNYLVEQNKKCIICKILSDGSEGFKF